MYPPTKLSRVVDGIRYDVTEATLLAGDNYWADGSNTRYGRNTFLYRTRKGRYFTVTLTQWENERNTLEPVSLARAIELYERQLTEHVVSFEEAFPDVPVEDA